MPWISPDVGAMIIVSAPASSKAFFGSVNSICSKSSVAKMATRMPCKSMRAISPSFDSQWYVLQVVYLILHAVTKIAQNGTRHDASRQLSVPQRGRIEREKGADEKEGTCEHNQVNEMRCAPCARSAEQERLRDLCALSYDSDAQGHA